MDYAKTVLLLSCDALWDYRRSLRVAFNHCSNVGALILGATGGFIAGFGGFDETAARDLLREDE
jgi:hypothetical protein